MITTYHRPQTLDAALALLSYPNVFPLGGGTLLASRHPQDDPVSVVDLQSIGLDSIHKKGSNLEIGATVTLQSLLENEHCPATLKPALKLESPLNVRNSATVAGALVSCDGRSPFATALLALDAKITVISNQLSVISSQSSIINVGDFLPLRPRGLITQIVISLNVKFSFEYVSRSPMDKPIVCVALTQWKSGRTRLALGGYGESPLLALDGIDADSIGSAQAAVRNAYREAADDWASSEYRMDVAATLAKRCLAA